jgi:hypothetical protein
LITLGTPVPLDPWDAIDWWESPAAAYWRGLVDGARLERARVDAEDDALHRAAVRRARHAVNRIDGWAAARAEADGRAA